MRRTDKRQAEIAIEAPPIPPVQCEGILRKNRCPRPAVVGGDGFCHRRAQWNMVLNTRLSRSGRPMRARRWTDGESYRD